MPAYIQTTRLPPVRLPPCTGTAPSCCSGLSFHSSLRVAFRSQASAVPTVRFHITVPPLLPAASVFPSFKRPCERLSKTETECAALKAAHSTIPRHYAPVHTEESTTPRSPGSSELRRLTATLHPARNVYSTQLYTRHEQ